jgi:NADPH:quinone reductase-like Zn-dependent oxidoreductase
VRGDGEAVVTVTAAALKPSDRLMASGVHLRPAEFPQIVGLDGVGWLPDGTRVAFFGPQPPYGGMAEQALVRPGMWLPVPDGIDDVSGTPGQEVHLPVDNLGPMAGRPHPDRPTAPNHE